MYDCLDHGQVGDRKGYGRYMRQQKKYSAHRVVYAESQGLHPRELGNVIIRHTCDNPRCINAEHLLPGTHLDNMEDRAARGRQATGETHGMSKLTASAVEYIRDVYVPRHRVYGGAALALQFGVRRVAINRVVRGLSWKGLM